MFSWGSSKNQIKASHYELAQICQQVYRNDGGYVTGWKCASVHEIKGIRLAVYQHELSNTMVIAFRGIDLNNATNFYYNSWLYLKIILGLSTCETEVACSMIEKVRGSRSFINKLNDLVKNLELNQLILVGHSMGGRLAQEAGLKFLEQGKSYQVFAIESPGLAITATQRQVYRKLFEKNYVTYLGNPNIINTRSHQIGTIHHVHFKPYKPGLYHMFLYYGKHVSSSVFYETARLMLYANMAKMILSYFVDDEFILSRFLTLPQAVFMFALSMFGLDEIFATNPDPAAYITLFAMLPILVKVIMPLIQNYFTDVLQQHTIDNFVRAMKNDSERPKRSTEMSSWPKASDYTVGCLMNGLNMFIPFGSRTPSLRTITDPETMEQCQIDHIPGYKPKKS